MEIFLTESNMSAVAINDKNETMIIIAFPWFQLIYFGYIKFNKTNIDDKTANE